MSLSQTCAKRFRELADQLDVAEAEMREAFRARNPTQPGIAPVPWRGFISIGGEYMGTPTVQIEYTDLAALFRFAADTMDNEVKA